MSRIDPEQQKAIDRFIATKGVTKLPPAGTSSMTEADRKAIAEHHAAVNEKHSRSLRSLTPAPDRKAEAARARDGVKAGVGFVQAREEKRAAARLNRKAHQPAAVAKQAMGGATTFNPGPRPVMAWLDAKLLDVDHRYQRPLQATHARKIAATFRWADFQAITVTDLGNGRYAAIDGQHRLRAALSIPEITDIPCYIVAKAGIAEQARTFLAINGSHQPVSQLEKFRAGLTAGDADYLAVDAIMREEGVAFVGTQKPTAMRTKAVGRIMRIYRTQGLQVLRKTLRAAAQAWPTEPEAFAALILTPLARVFWIGKGLIPVEKAVPLLVTLKPTRFIADMMIRAKEQGGSGEAMVFAELHRQLLGREFVR